MGETPIARLARWFNEPRVRACATCGDPMPAAPRTAKVFWCSDACAEAELAGTAY
jgi:endogenous inhibitor of DNA gyrase (YacG/DUF329 family)